jgi:hypothetical protein
MFLTADVSALHANGHVVYNYVVQKKPWPCCLRLCTLMYFSSPEKFNTKTVTISYVTESICYVSDGRCFNVTRQWACCLQLRSPEKGFVLWNNLSNKSVSRKDNKYVSNMWFHRLLYKAFATEAPTVSILFPLPLTWPLLFHRSKNWHTSEWRLMSSA